MKYSSRSKDLKTGLAIVFACLLMAQWSFPRERGNCESEATGLSGPVLAVRINSSINPGSLELLTRAIKTAGAKKACCVLILLDTPGGLVVTLRKMVQEIMQSPVPVIVYVYPPGAQAASAGAILTISADIAVMAPGTNIGAAHPVNMGHGPEGNSTMAQKMENDLAALAVSIAGERKRNAKWAEEAVRESKSVSASTALRLNVIDFMARDIPDLIEMIRGRKIRMANGRTVIIRPESRDVVTMEENLREKILKTIADPNIAYILMTIGMVGLYFELAHPGAIFPGIAGAICLILAFYALQTLSANITGIVLVALAFLLFILELFITSHGILALSGVIALLMGSLMLFDPKTTGLSISHSVLWPTLLSVSVFLGIIAFLSARATLSRPKTGAEGLVGLEGTVKEILPDGHYMVFIHGELWRSESSSPLKSGERVRVKSVKGLKLIVQPVEV